jgi:hypothetical protein
MNRYRTESMRWILEKVLVEHSNRSKTVLLVRR